MIEEIIARMTANEMKLTKLEKNKMEQKKQVKKKKKKEEELNSDKNLSDLNIMKYFYLNMARSVNVSEVSYINSFKSRAELKRRFQY